MGFPKTLKSESGKPTSHGRTPPRLAAWIVTRSTVEADRQAVVGDLIEEFAALNEQFGARAGAPMVLAAGADVRAPRSRFAVFVNGPTLTALQRIAS